MWARELEAFVLSEEIQPGDVYVTEKENKFGVTDADMPLQFHVCSARLKFSDKKGN